MKGRILVVGGGGSGVINALALANQGYLITLVEQWKTLLGITTDATAWRAGTGPHYYKIETAKHMMEYGASFIREFVDFIEAESAGTAYNILKGQPFKSLAEYEAYVEEIKAHYIKLIAQDPLNKVFGEPEQLFTRLPTAPEQLKTRYINYIAEIKQETPNNILSSNKEENEWFDSPLDTPEQIQAHYSKLLQKNPMKETEIFGKPEQLFARLQPETLQVPDPEHPGQIKTLEVMARYWAAEKIIAWPKLKQDLITRVKNHPNITVYENTKVVSCERTVVVENDEHNDKRMAKIEYKLEVQHSGSLEQKTLIDSEKLKGTQFLNCSSWDIEKLDRTISPLPESQKEQEKKDENSQKTERTNRTKAMLEVELPDNFNLPYIPKELHDKLYGAIYCYGAHAGLTLIGKNPTTGKMRALVSYEPGTNIENNEDLELKELSYRLLTRTATPQEEKKIVDKIFAGAAHYFPGLEKAMPIGLKPGNVRIEGGPVNIYAFTSSHNDRIDSGIDSGALFHFRNPLAKLVAIASHRDESVFLINNHQDANNQINQAINDSPLSIHGARAAYKQIDTLLSDDLRHFKVESKIPAKKDSDKKTGIIQKSWLTTILGSIKNKANALASLAKTNVQPKEPAKGKGSPTLSAASSTSLESSPESSPREPLSPLSNSSELSLDDFEAPILLSTARVLSTISERSPYNSPTHTSLSQKISRREGVLLRGLADQRPNSTLGCAEKPILQLCNSKLNKRTRSMNSGMPSPKKNKNDGVLSRGLSNKQQNDAPLLCTADLIIRVCCSPSA